MGSDTIPQRTDGSTIFAEWANVFRRVLAVNLVPRNSSGVATNEGGDLGESSTRWNNAYVKTVVADTVTGTTVQAKANTNYTVSLKAPTGLPASYDLIPPKTAGGFVPSGVILPFGGATAPTGYLLCDGTSYLQADYAELFAAIGTAFGSADGTHFNVPDLKGRFLRGVDGTAGRDPDKATRTAMATGGNAGNLVGSVQDEQFKAHTHDQIYMSGLDAGSTLADGGGAGNVLNTTTATTVLSAGGNETRPKNAYVNYIIKT